MKKQIYDKLGTFMQLGSLKQAFVDFGPVDVADTVFNPSRMLRRPELLRVRCNQPSVFPFAKFTLGDRLPKIVDMALGPGSWLSSSLRFDARILSDQSSDKLLLPRIRRLAHDEACANVPASPHDLFEEVPVTDEMPAGYGYLSQFLDQYGSERWSDLPRSIDAESLVYRLTIEQLGFFQLQAKDPWMDDKFTATVGCEETLLPQLTGLLGARAEPVSFESFQAALHASLWSNSFDLSLNPGQEATDQPPITSQPARLLRDDSAAVYDYLRGTAAAGSCVAIVTDNAGPELLADLVLATRLLDGQLVNQIVFHVKSAPTFVSDATSADFATLLSWLAVGFDRDPDAFRLWPRVEQHLVDQRLMYASPLIWSAPSTFPGLPSHVRDSLTKCALVVFKGDANYRRLVDDVADEDISFGESVEYWPDGTALLAMRTLKSEVITAIPPERVSQLDSGPAPDSGDYWKTNGKYGTISFNLV